jgi:hypothetical protein
MMLPTPFQRPKMAGTNPLPTPFRCRFQPPSDGVPSNPPYTPQLEQGALRAPLFQQREHLLEPDI